MANDPTFTAAQLRLLAGYAQGRIATALRFAARLVEENARLRAALAEISEKQRTHPKTAALARAALRAERGTDGE